MATQRIDKLKKCITYSDVLFVDNPVDIYYLTGVSLSLGRLVISQEKAELFVDGRYIGIAKAKAPCVVFLAGDIKKHVKGSIGFDSSFLSYDGFLDLQKQFPEHTLIPISKPLKNLRMLKDSDEIAKLKKAASLTRAGYQHIRSLLKEGVSEEFLALEFEFFCRKKGASKLSFDPIVAFGPNSAYPHHRAGKTTLKKDQIVLIDVGCVVDGYAGDMTRCDFFGEVDAQLKKDYALIEKVQKKVIAHVKPGIAFGELDTMARSEFEKVGVASLFTHGLSHGIGLDVHEYPGLRIQGGDHKLILEPGMTFTVEPGLYREGLGGVRYEDVVLVTRDGYEIL